ncbi:PREDICTED: mitochondrial ribosome-associated GTPase 1 isoform X2 [Hipposideros armiger]|uniref:Mitochondrial ribosome-associated GTPase 1 isoform X2 n=1 Tax=Hipposideros armiger TaxID=186990 RepID=A0A8B7RHD7_HIPAR|nr:PREDICTED: mitochondrial ribosome-associated GTPase 1 isoform X2 [Hipposideros armiger]
MKTPRTSPAPLVPRAATALLQPPHCTPRPDSPKKRWPGARSARRPWAALRVGRSGAMADAGGWLKKMQSSLKLVDCIVEVHDARIPLSGRNPLFRETLGIKPHLLVLNKMDLADLSQRQKILQHLEREGLKNVIFTNCVKDENVKQVIPAVTELVRSSCRYHRGENVEHCIMVIGVPNVGKSSLINSLRRQHLRKGKATRVGGEPGITRAVMSRVQVSERPLVFLLDTPGVLPPRIESVETGLKLALCGDRPGAETVPSPSAARFQGLCWTTWWERRAWLTTFSTPSTGSGSLGEFGCGWRPLNEEQDVTDDSDSTCHLACRWTRDTRAHL